MATFVFIHGAGDVGWYWHLVEADLRARGHDTVAPDLPCDDDAAGLSDYADTVVRAVGDRTGLVVVGQSSGGFTAPLVCDRLPADLLVLVAPMIPRPGEPPADYFSGTRYAGEPWQTYDDTISLFYPDVPPDLAAEAVSRSREQSEARMTEPWPLDAWPDVPTRVLIARDDRLFPPDFLRRVARERLGLTPDEIDGGHTPALSRPHELADRLAAYAAEHPRPGSRPEAGDDVGPGRSKPGGGPSRPEPGGGPGRPEAGYDAELRRHNAALRRVAAVQAHEHVLDIGCGSGQTTREAARAATAGSAHGVDVSAAAIERARELARADGLPNLTFEHADAQVHHFPPARFDLAMSRFGTMFFTDPAAAFTTVRRALRPGGRLVMAVWQAAERNEWDVVLRRCLDTSAAAVQGLDPFSLADPPTVRELLQGAGFTGVTFTDVHEPVYFGPDVAAALEWVRGFACTRQALESLGDTAAAAADERLRQALTEHRRDDGVWFDSRAWIVTAHHPTPGRTRR